jgi:hypothetical protein
VHFADRLLPVCRQQLQQVPCKGAVMPLLTFTPVFMSPLFASVLQAGAASVVISNCASVSDLVLRYKEGPISVESRCSRPLMVEVRRSSCSAGAL